MMPTAMRIMPTIPAGFTMRMLQRPPTANQLDNEHDQRDEEQQMNVSAENMEADKTEKPENQQNNKDSPKHKKPFVRSEERRVGKECRSRCWTDQEKKG